MRLGTGCALLSTDPRAPLSLGEVDVLMARVRWYLSQAHQEVTGILERGSGSTVLAESSAELSELEHALTARMSAIAALRQVLAQRLIDGIAQPEGGVAVTGVQHGPRRQSQAQAGHR